MFEVITTGTNECYGKKNEKRLLSDSHLICAVKNGYVKPNVKYVGNGSMSLRIITKHDKCRLCGKSKFDNK